MRATVTPKQHPADVPVYSLQDACRYLHAPWAAVAGLVNPGAILGKRRSVGPLINEKLDKPQFSFRQLVSAHVISVLARWGELGGKGLELNTWPAVRAIEDVAHNPPDEAGWQGKVGEHLIEVYLRAFKIEVAEAPKYRHLLDLHLSRVEWGEDGAPARLYPFTRPNPEDAPKLIAIAPQIRFGNPAFVRTGPRPTRSGGASRRGSRLLPWPMITG